MPTVVLMNCSEEVEWPQPPGTAIICLYGCILVIGLLGNGSLALALCCGPGAKTKNPLQLGLCFADLLVCCVSGPATAALNSPYLLPWTFTEYWHNVAIFAQAWPTAVSTLSLMAISVDRYLTLKAPRKVGPAVHRRQALAIAAITAWLLGALLSSPQLLDSYQRSPWTRYAIIGRILLVYVVPASAVLVCHLGVHSKLTALSLTARAAHGELPLPMPLLRKPTHVIIVAGLANRPDTKVMTYRAADADDEPNSEDSTKECSGRLVDTGLLQAPGKLHEMRRKQSRGACGTRQALRSEREIREDTRRKRPAPTPEQPVTSTLRSRRRLANSLLWVAAVFAGCWIPYVVCYLCVELCTAPPTNLLHYSLMLGQAHSALSPILYWALNHQSLQPPCHFRLPALYRNASSTNEAALGPFHPRYVRPPRPPPMRRHSSHYLY